MSNSSTSAFRLAYGLSAKIVRNDWKEIYVFKLEHKKILFCEIYSMKKIIQQVNLDSSTC